MEPPPPPPADADADSELVTLVAGGDRQAERVLCERFAERIRLYGLRHLRDEDAARELVQHVLLLVIERLRDGTIEEPGRLASFVLGTCRFVVWDLRRGERRRQELARRSAVGELLAEEPDVARLEVRRLEPCLGRLSPRELAVVRLSFQEDRSAEEVGTALELSPGNVRVIRHRTLQRLQACLEETT